MSGMDDLIERLQRTVSDLCAQLLDAMAAGPVDDSVIAEKRAQLDGLNADIASRVAALSFVPDED